MVDEQFGNNLIMKKEYEILINKVFSPEGKFNNFSTDLSKKVLSIPMHPYMPVGQSHFISSTIKRFFD